MSYEPTELPIESNPYGSPTGIAVAIVLPEAFTAGTQALWVDTSRDLLQRFRLTEVGH